MNNYKRILLLCVGILVLTIPVYAQNNTGSPNIDSLISKKMSESGIVGLGAAIIVDKKVVWKKGDGLWLK